MLDITDRKSMERALRESERQLQEVIQDFPLPTFVISPDHTVRHWNRAMEEFSGIRAMDVVGTRDHWKAFYPEMRPCMIDLVLDGETDVFSRWYSGEALKSPLLEDAHEVTEFLPLLKEGGIWLKGTAAMLRNTGGEVAGAIEIVENITDRKRAEAELIRHRDKLGELVAERTRELSDINVELQREIAERKEAEAELSKAHVELEHQVALRTRELRQLNEELTRQSLQDGLTGISNHRYFDEFLKREWERAKREKTSLSVIIADVDCFKNYNDTYGHVAGDTCLKAVASILRTTSKRAVDLVARYGGEEFVLVLPGTDLAAATALAEDARAGVERLGIEHRTSFVPPSGSGSHTTFVTISLGVASLVPRGSMNPSRLIAAADKGLYDAKNSGRNRVAAGTQLPTG
jgi:diguanylate cyclase (GGDEF)-like protein